MFEVKSIGIEDPEYFAELLSKIHRPADRRLPHERLCPYGPGIQNIDGSLAQRLQTILDTVAEISLCQRGNVSAATASLKDNRGTLDTQLYIIFNHEDDEAARRSAQHLQRIFNMLSRVPYTPPATDGSSKTIANELENEFIEICKVIHDYSFDIFAHRVNKHKHELSVVRGYIEQDETHFTPQNRSMLMSFLTHVGGIINDVANAQNSKRLPVISIKTLLALYSYWKEHNLLPSDPLDDDTDTLLDSADEWLAEVHGIGFRLRRWAVKIMSLLISAKRLFLPTQSSRLRKLIEGKFSVHVLTSPTTVPYRCDLSSETIQIALDAALAERVYLGADLAEKCRESFIEQFLQKGQDFSRVDRWKPTVHAELAMIMAIVNGEINDVFPYIGVSKLSCVMCSHYICVFNEVMEDKIATRGSHEKAYPGWFWPSLPNHDEELRPAFLRRVRWQLVSDLRLYAGRLPSDSSVGSKPPWHTGVTSDEIADLFAVPREYG